MNIFDSTLADYVSETSSVVSAIICNEAMRQRDTVELIASENFCSNAVRAAMASCFTNKYCEGYPDMERSGNRGRYYGGCFNADILEQYCCTLWQKVFNTDYHVNVQPHSGSQANFAAYQAILKPGDTILAMDLNDGGHLTHGSKANFSGKLYNIVTYSTDARGFINYTDVRNKAMQCKPAVIVAGASAYPRSIDFATFSIIAKEAGSYLMVDMAHIAGLVAAGAHQSPFGYADIITTTTHKTLRGPRGGLVFCRPDLAKKVDSAIFPCSQGGPLMHIIAGKAVCAEEALQLSFKSYINQVVLNAAAMAKAFEDHGYDVITGGTDNHLLLLDFSRTHPNITGQMVQDALDKVGITLNKNCVPFETRSPKETSGVRIGTAPMTTKGWLEADFVQCAATIDSVIKTL